MNDINNRLFTAIFELTGSSTAYNAVIVFCAEYLIYGLFLVAAIVAGLLVRRKQWTSIALLGVNLVASFAAVRLLALAHASSRPFVDHDITPLIDHAANQSFPSDHTAAAFAVAFGIVAFTRHKAIGFAAIGVAALIGYARIAAGVHYPFDIIGSIVACAVVTGTILLLIYAKRRPTRR